jgi:hypothetical protein
MYASTYRSMSYAHFNNPENLRQQNRTELLLPQNLGDDIYKKVRNVRKVISYPLSKTPPTMFLDYTFLTFLTFL